MLWKGLMVVTGSESPVRVWCDACHTLTSSLQIVVVLTGSMEPGFWRGDILFLYNPTTPMRTSDVVVYNIDKREIPIVHRTIKVHEQHDGDFLFLTKVGGHSQRTSLAPPHRGTTTTATITAGGSMRLGKSGSHGRASSAAWWDTCQQSGMSPSS